ncbi:hypothetical protein VTO42DRAFT_2651 [Malbranchea cinnamomea]
MAPKGGPAPGKRNPTVLVTDSRDQAQSRRRGRSNTQPGSASRFITVDNVLQYASDIPSMQQRLPRPGGFGVRPRGRIGGSGATSSSAGAGDIGTIGGGSSASGMDSRVRVAGRLASLPNLPSRTTKVSEKLVLLPETVTEEEEEEEESETEKTKDEEEHTGEARAKRRPGRRVSFAEVPPADEQAGGPAAAKSRRLRDQQRLRRKDFAVDNEAAPLRAEEEALKRRQISPEKGKSYAERLPKARRAEKLPRVTAYCTAQAYKMGATAAFVKEYHGARTKLYDDCLYTAYHLPLLPGVGGYRVRSSPVLKNAGGKAVLDEEIERNEQRDYHEEYYTEAEEHSVRLRSEDHGAESAGENRIRPESEDHQKTDVGAFHSSAQSGDEGYPRKAMRRSQSDYAKPASANRIPPNALSFAEMFVFSYGVVVFWNFTERQEKDVLADLAFSSDRPGSIPLATNPLPEEDFETEEFHFEYSTEISRPRVYNDMITLRSGDHMIKLAISHGIAQSTKLSLFEEAMARQMAEAKDVPRRLALTGHLGMKREEVFRILGKLFKSRVEVNLSSNMLDVPNFFWDSEPTLHPLYIAVREYLEIKPRIQVLNERCRVFLDLTEILSDSVAHNKESRQTWIIIVLIGISIIVTLAEVILRFGILSARSSSSSPSSAVCPSSMISLAKDGSAL